MINVDNTISMLRKLEPVGDPAAVQRYAQMHKNDPYIMSLAMSEANRRKEALAAQHLNAPQQPKVVDQAIQGMAAPMPEHVGIGQLPAGDMNFADGGIVAFSGGGDVPRYQSQGLVRYPGVMQYGGTYPGQPGGGLMFGNAQGMTGYEGMGAKEFLGTVYTQALRKLGLEDKAAKLTPAEQRAAEAEANKIAVTKGMEYSPENYGVSKPAPAFVDPRLVGKTPPEQTVAAAPPLAAPTADAGAAGAKGPGQRTPSGGPAAAPAAAPAATTPAQGGLADLQKTYEDIAAKQTYKDPAADRLSALEVKETAAAQAEKAALERDQARFADVFKGREARLGKRETEIGEQKDTNTNLSLLNAGLAIMSTPGGLATALGKGAQVGTAHFAAGLDKIRSAQDKLDEARDRMEELKLNRDEMDAKEIRAAESKIRNVGIDGEKRAIDGIRQAAQVNRETAKAVFDKTAQLGITQLEVAGREKVAQIGLQGHMAQAAATRAASEGSRMSTLAESVRKNIAAEALKKFPYDTNAQANYEQQALQAALRTNPGLAQYLGIPGGGGGTAQLNPSDAALVQKYTGR
jgi:hypothetical protein